ncbi:MAG: tetratricopeptide repeat protein [Sandaracinus sp.]|nr:tetratricopeptide repeat protein [Sandaracinus sp.]MCB9619657.1 tetratricopeptide repeat protein [Sandaracinus sp.]MCB9636406.1 tetratricopeptide repeat protein [Sandaracinus sp.]
MRHAFFLGAVLAASTVSAQTDPPASENTLSDEERDEQGRQLFLAGATAYEGGRYEVALANFQAALELTGRGPLWYNVALAHDRLRHDSEALAAYRTYLQEVPDNPHRAQVEARIDALARAESERAEQAAALERERQAAAEREAREAELERELAAARTEVREEKKSRWWIGVVVGAVVAVAVGVGLAVALSGGGDSYEQSDFGGVTFTLGGGR